VKVKAASGAPGLTLTACVTEREPAEFVAFSLTLYVFGAE
jgi:hypothetical protein